MGVPVVFRQASTTCHDSSGQVIAAVDISAHPFQQGHDGEVEEIWWH